MNKSRCKPPASRSVSGFELLASEGEASESRGLNATETGLEEKQGVSLFTLTPSEAKLPFAVHAREGADRCASQGENVQGDDLCENVCCAGCIGLHWVGGVGRAYREEGGGVVEVAAGEGLLDLHGSVSGAPATRQIAA